MKSFISKNKKKLGSLRVHKRFLVINLKKQKTKLRQNSKIGQACLQFLKHTRQVCFKIVHMLKHNI